MKVEFILGESTATNKEGKEFKYYVLSRKLVDGTEIQIPIKSEKARLINMSIHLENK